MAAGTAQAVASPRPGYIFALTQLGRGFNPALVAPSYVDGLALQIGWHELEPEPGQYRWDRLDAMVGAAAARGKKVTLHVLPLHPPEWIFDEGAQAFTFTMGRRGGGPNAGRQMREVLPWDPVFLDRWEKLTTDLGRHYNGNDAVLAVSVTAPSPEMALPGGIPGTDSFLQLEKLYSKDVYFRAWKRMIDVYQAAFPDKAKLLVPGIVLIDEDFADDVVTYAHGRYGDRLWLFNAGLRAGGVPQAHILRGHVGDILTGYAARGGRLGLQTIWSSTDDPNGRMQGTLHEALDAGLKMGASYFEIYAVDVQNSDLQSELSDLKHRLGG
jgi:hypothetical protein